MDLSYKLTTERLVLRPYLEGDERDFLTMLKNGNREHLDELLGPLAQVNSEDELSNTLKEWSNNWNQDIRYVLSFWDRGEGTYYGHIWIEPVEKALMNYEIGWFIDRNHEGRGLVTEAAKKGIEFIFNNLQANKIIVRVRNHGVYEQKSINVAKRLEFKREGLLRNTVRVVTSKGVGPVVGEHYFGMLREEYLIKRNE